MAPSFSIGRFPLRMHDNTSFVLQLTVWSKHCILCCLSGELDINMSLSELGNLVTKPQQHLRKAWQLNYTCIDEVWTSV